MAVIPPWISVNPKDFVDAAAGGARIGAELAGQQNEANIATGRNATALQEAQMRVNAEQSAQQEEAQRAAQERALREWEMRQQILHQSAQLTGENQRSQNMLDAENARAANALSEREKYGNSMLDIRREANRIAQERADAAAKKAEATGNTSTVYADYPGSKGVPQFNSTDRGQFNLFKSNVPASSLTTTNAADLNQYLAQHPSATTTTNIAPGTATPSLRIPYKLPSSSIAPGIDPRQLLSQPSNPLEGKRVRDKVTGKTGTISNGQFIPDSGGDANPVP